MLYTRKYVLLLAAGLILAACTAKQDPVATEPTGPAEVVLMPAVTEVKASLFNTGDLRDNKSGNYFPMFVSATAKTSPSVTKILATGLRFNRQGTTPNYYKPVTPVYWPFSGSMDFLAYAGFESAPSSNPTVTWSSVPSQRVSFTFTDTKAADADLVGAATNSVTNHAAPVRLDFNHAMSRIVVYIKAPVEAAGHLVVSKIEIRTGTSDYLSCAGTYTVDNTYVVPVGKWSNLSSSASASTVFSGSIAFSTTGYEDLLRPGQTAGPAKTNADVTFAAVVVPEQARKQIVVTYSIDGGAATQQVFNIPAGMWESGHNYRYRITISNTLFP